MVPKPNNNLSGINQYMVPSLSTIKCAETFSLLAFTISLLSENSIGGFNLLNDLSKLISAVQCMTIILGVISIRIYTEPIMLSNILLS